MSDEQAAYYLILGIILIILIIPLVLAGWTIWKASNDEPDV